MAEEVQRDYSHYVAPVGIVLLAWVAYEHFFGSGSTGAQITAADTTGVQSTLDAQKQSGENPTITAAQAAQTANTIYNYAISTTSAPFPSEISYNVKWALINNVNNLTDLLLIMQQFGTRNANTTGLFSLCSLTMLTVDCTKIDLTALIRMGLQPNDLTDVNMFLSGANINYQF